ncbi:MAG: 50S ribosomal protein L17 [Candidatus Atribacteria bacterium]|jgi:large subunit ribosomal protein L17|nr:50S ribosomal protein L17 [Candidatus Atribacteria bacterium]
MRHKKLKGKLGRTSSERSSLLANLSISLITHKKIETTYAKAKEVRKYIEKLVTTAKNNNLQAQRKILKVIKNRRASKILFEEISPKYLERNGGYTRIVKTGFRKGDAAPLAVIEFIE